MKLATLLFFFVFTQAFAGSCAPEIEALFLDVETEPVPVLVVDHHENWSSMERSMIRDAVAADDYWNNVSIPEALDLFADRNEWSGNLPGSHSGSVSYYRLDGKLFAKVTYYPGDNEYGAIFGIDSKSYRLLTAVQDGDLSCQYE